MPYRSSEINWRYLTKVHGCQSGVESTINSNKYPSGNKHFIWFGRIWEAFENSANYSKYVIDNKPAFPEKPKAFDIVCFLI